MEEKDAQPTERTAALRIVKQNRFKNLGELHKEWTEAGVKASRATTHRRVEEFGYSCHQRRFTWAKEKKNQSPKSSVQMRASFVFHLETKVLESGGRVEKLIAQVAIVIFYHYLTNKLIIFNNYNLLFYFMNLTDMNQKIFYNKYIRILASIQNQHFISKGCNLKLNNKV